MRDFARLRRAKSAPVGSRFPVLAVAVRADPIHHIPDSRSAFQVGFRLFFRDVEESIQLELGRRGGAFPATIQPERVVLVAGSQKHLADRHGRRSVAHAAILVHARLLLGSRAGGKKGETAPGPGYQRDGVLTDEPPARAEMATAVILPHREPESITVAGLSAREPFSIIRLLRQTGLRLGCRFKVTH
jgi:hypothetical protein